MSLEEAKRACDECFSRSIKLHLRFFLSVLRSTKGQKKQKLDVDRVLIFKLLLA